MKWLRGKYRLWRLRFCQWRGHPMGYGDIAFGWQEPDRLMPDGTIQSGDSFEWRTTYCEKCHPR